MADELHPAIAALESEDPLATHRQMILPIVEAAQAAFAKLVELHGTGDTGNAIMRDVSSLMLTSHLVLLEKYAPPEHHARLLAEAVKRGTAVAKLLFEGKTISEALDHLAGDKEDD